MDYRAHRLEVSEDTAQEKLEHFLNKLDGDVLSVVPITIPKFKPMGATSVVKFFLIVEAKK